MNLCLGTPTKQEIPISQLSGKEKAKRKKAGLLLDMPCDVVRDILLRLPLSSLIRFKVVNRYWHSLISGHEFALQHFNNQTNNAGPSPRRYGVIRVSNIPQQQLPRLSLYMHRRAADEEDSDTVVVETAGLPNPLELLEYYKNTNDTQVLGSCNGLLLIGYGIKPKQFILFNPSTGQDKRLPLNHFCESPTTFMAGLGYDCSSDNYKAVVAVYGGDTQLINVVVYNLKTNSWAMAENTEITYKFSSSQTGVTTNGAPHWVLKRGDNGGLANVIIYFDLVKENFKELPLPGELVNAGDIFLGACKGFLCVGGFVRRYPKQYMIWIMKEYGVKESWTILMDIPYRNLSYRILRFQHLMSLRFPKKSKALMILDWNSVAICNSIGMKDKTVSFSGDQEGLIVATYMESLISPNNYG